VFEVNTSVNSIHADIVMSPVQVKEITSMYASDVSRWTAEALTALQEVASHSFAEINHGHCYCDPYINRHLHA
jgi:hypothetical protein